MLAEVERPPNQNSLGVYKPKDDDLLIRGTIGNVFNDPRKKSSTKSGTMQRKRAAAKSLLSDVPKPFVLPPQSHLNLPSPRGLADTSPQRSSRPLTKSSSRFGAYSQASFFSRHNPHPIRVRHISGLNGQPICAVNDHDNFPQPRFSIRTPSTRERERIFNTHIPRNALGLNSSAFPINIITGLQNYPYREKALPSIGLVPITDSWREELQEFCHKAGLFAEIHQQQPRPITPPSLLPQTKRRTIYSSETGRLLPPPSRAMSRQSSRQSVRLQGSTSGPYQHISAYPDTETLMLEMLCQILQTDSVHAVQQWLVSAGDREKALVLDMIKSAMSNEEEILRQQTEKEEALKDAGKVSRPLTTHSVSRPATAAHVEVKPGTAMGSRPGTTELMKPQRTEQGAAEILKLDRATPVSPRKLSSARPLGTPSRPESRKAVSALNARSPTMRYTKTPKSAPSRNEPMPIIQEDAKETLEEE